MEQSILMTGDRPVGRTAVLKTVVTRRLGQLRRYLWVVVVVTASAGAAAAHSSLSAGDSYAAKSALVVSSPGRSPEQDAVLAVGYATLFNDPATIARLRAARAVPDDIGVEASTAAASPIVTVQATAASPEAAQDAAQAMAEAFRDDMNAARQKEADATVADLQRQIDEFRSRPGPEGGPDPAIAPLQESIGAVQFNSTTNQLRDLQMRVGAVRNPPKTAVKLLLGLTGGLLFGVFAAFALAALSSRLMSPADVREKTGIDPLVELPRNNPEKSGLLEARMRTLANALNARSTASPMVLAVTDTRGVSGARQIAEALAALAAQQGRRTVLVLTGTDTDTDTEPPLDAGFNDALRDSRIVGALLKQGRADALTVLTAGSGDVDRHTLLTEHRLSAVLDQLRAGADVIVVAAPSITETTDAQVICAAANLTVMVISKSVSRTGDVVAAAETLVAVGATVAGAVLLEGRGRPSIPVRTGPAARHRSLVADAVKA